MLSTAFPPVTVRAPGRVELLGNHTDYNEGRVLSAAISFGIDARGVRRPDGDVVLRTVGFAAAPVRIIAEEAGKGELRPLVGDDAWANYALGSVHELRAAGFPVGGFEAEFSGDLPVGAGLSSSAAMEVSTACLLLRLHGWEMPPLELAKLCRRAENDFVGVPCGLLDQVSSVFGRRGHVVVLDCRDETVGHAPLPPDVALVVFHTNVAHRLVGGEYAERRAQCFEAARRLGAPALRDVSPAQLEAARRTLDDVLWRRAAHIVGENTRVVAGREHLRRGDARAFGELMFQSHASSQVNFENSTPELDALVAVARETPGVLGARLTGGGFGGATVNLVERAQATAVADALARGYTARTGNVGRAYPCEAADGAVSVGGG